MIALLLALLFAQGIPPLPGQTGIVSGVLRTAAGEPAAGVRVSAMVPPESDIDLRSAAAFGALTETDIEGRYRLEGIPQGRYYIVAGRVDQPTYYPGTEEMAKARIFSIAPGGEVSGIDFAMVDSSLRNRALPTASQLTVLMNVSFEGNAKLPVFAAGEFTRIRFTNIAGGAQVTTPLRSRASLGFSISTGATRPEFRVSIENLPESYFVKSMTFGADNITTGILKIPQENMPRIAVATVAGVTQQVTTQISATGAPMPTLMITLAADGLPPAVGVRVSGQTKDAEVRSVYLSGSPGTFYSDGTFEFRGVGPGRYVAAALGTRPGVMSLAASVIVGNRDLDGVDLKETITLPADVTVPVAAGPVGDHAPGSVLPLVSLRGRAVEERSGQPIEEGAIRLIGRDPVEVPIGAEGHFEFPKLLPGTYNLEMQIFGHSIVRQTVTIGEEDVILDVISQRLY